MKKTHKYLHTLLAKAVDGFDSRLKKQIDDWRKDDTVDLTFFGLEGEHLSHLDAKAERIQELYEMLDETLQAEKDAQDSDAFRRVISIIKEEWS